MQQQIPDLVAERVLDTRRQIYASNAQAWKRRALREGSSPELPPHQHEAGLSLEEMGGSGLTTKPLVLDKELQFWAMDDDEELEEFLSGDLMPALLDASPEQWRQLAGRLRAADPGARIRAPQPVRRLVRGRESRR